jgi:DNA invertase Pin-like site-specific DNA recombinase
MVAVYERVSTLGQNEAGQRRDIERWLDGNGIARARSAMRTKTQRRRNSGRDESQPEDDSALSSCG